MGNNLPSVILKSRSKADQKQWTQPLMTLALLTVASYVFMVPSSLVLTVCFVLLASFRNDSSFSYVIFFLLYFLHIAINIFYTLGIPGGGTW